MPRAVRKPKRKEPRGHGATAARTDACACAMVDTRETRAKCARPARIRIDQRLFPRCACRTAVVGATEIRCLPLPDRPRERRQRWRTSRVSERGKEADEPKRSEVQDLIKWNRNQTHEKATRQITEEVKGPWPVESQPTLSAMRNARAPDSGTQRP